MQLVLICLVGVGLTASVIAFVMMSRRLARIEEALGLREPAQLRVLGSQPPTEPRRRRSGSQRPSSLTRNRTGDRRGREARMLALLRQHLR